MRAQSTSSPSTPGKDSNSHPRPTSHTRRLPLPQHQRYDLFALVVMPDHVHMLMQPLPKTEDEYWSLSSILPSIKSYSAKQILKVMPPIGTPRQPERYDHIVRNDRAFRAIGHYIRQNTVKAKLVTLPDGYPFLW